MSVASTMSCHTRCCLVSSVNILNFLPVLAPQVHIQQEGCSQRGGLGFESPANFFPGLFFQT